MKCPVCGKENPDIRLFCMSCGELLPEDEVQTTVKEITDSSPFKRDDVEIAAEPDFTEPASEENTVPVDIPEETADEDTEFYRNRSKSRRVIEEAWPEVNNIPKSVSPKSIFDYEDTDNHFSNEESAFSKPVSEEQRHQPAIEKPSIPEIGTPSTIIPKRKEELGPDDFFAVKGQVMPDYDEDDEADQAPSKSRYHSDYEDEPRQSFFVRHMRSVVSLMLLMLTLAIVLVWANTDSAQLTLATLDIAWHPEAYARLAADSYSSGDLSAAGYYYSQAAKRDPDNYNYAIGAANAYIEGGYTTKALSAVRNCISMNPTDVNLYLVLLELQPDMYSISSGDLSLLQQGYEITGDERLNIE